MCCFSSKHAALMSKSNDLLGRNQDNVSMWTDFNNISAILWRSVLGENHQVHLAMSGLRSHNLVVLGSVCIGGCKSNYHITRTVSELALLKKRSN